MEGADPAVARRASHLAARFAVPALLLVAEYLGISLVVDLPTGGAARPLADAVRVLVPVLLGAGAAAAILGGSSLVVRATALAATLPRWRAWPMLGVQVAAYGALAASARVLLGSGGATPNPRLLAAWLVAAGAVGLLAVAVAVPLRWLARELWVGAALPVAALACGLLAWRAATAAEASWGALSGPTLHGVSWVLALAGAGPDVDAPARIIGVRDFYVEIAPVCSGADGVGLVLVFQGLWVTLRRHQLRVGRALLLLPLGAAAAFGANVVRLAALLLLGASGAEHIAIGGFHSKAGWVLFVALALGSVAVAERWRWLHREHGAIGTAVAPLLPDTALPHLAPLLATLAAALATGASPPERSTCSTAPASSPGPARSSRSAARCRAPTARPDSCLARSARAWRQCGASFPAATGRRSRPRCARSRPWSGPRGFGARLVGSILVIPLVEELAFRGFLLPWLSAPGRVPAPACRGMSWPWGAVIVSSVAFGAAHTNFLLGTAAASRSAYARVRRGRLSDAVVAHVVANAGVAASVLCTRPMGPLGVIGSEPRRLHPSGRFARGWREEAPRREGRPWDSRRNARAMYLFCC